MHDGLDGETPSRVTFELEEINGQVKLTMTHDDFADDSQVLPENPNGLAGDPVVAQEPARDRQGIAAVLARRLRQKITRVVRAKARACVVEGRAPRVPREAPFHFLSGARAIECGDVVTRELDLRRPLMSASCAIVVALAIGAVTSGCAISQAEQG